MPIVLAATPIGDVEDASPKLLRLIATADIVAAEDTRRLLNLAGRAGIEIAGKVIAFHDHNEAEKTAGLLATAREGKLVLVVSDAGMPTVSDPGFHLVKAAIDAQVELTAVPGPSAVLDALALSGLPTDRFAFEGFLPRKDGQQNNYLHKLSSEKRTMVFFESPRRILETVTKMAEAFGGDRPAALCRELTKTHEEVIRGTLDDLAERARNGVLGEITLVVAGAGGTADTDVLVLEVLALEKLGVRLKDAASHVATREHASTNTLYMAALSQRSTP